MLLDFYKNCTGTNRSLWSSVLLLKAVKFFQYLWGSVTNPTLLNKAQNGLRMNEKHLLECDYVALAVH